MNLDLTCQCGARLAVTVTYAVDMDRERRAFDQAHEVCRERGRPLVMWEGDQA